MSTNWKPDKIRSSDITPEAVYLNRRQFMKGAAVFAAGAVLAACAPQIAPQAPTPLPAEVGAMAGQKDELGDPLTVYAAVTGYNNYYEFTQSKEGVAGLAHDFKTRPWTVAVGGLVNKPRPYDIDELIKRFPVQERIYRLRCVEGWSMVIPWRGFPLKQLLAEVEPTNAAKYVRFQTILDPQQMPGQSDPSFPWPYTEGLRMDEAQNDLTLLTTGVYGQDLLPQNGAPIRIVTPWKYGFKSVKAIVKIDLVADQPSTLWPLTAPDEYGFYANVNPNVPHPRWSQSTERRIGDADRRPTLLFNGYADQVASMYAGMDLHANF